MLALLFSLLIFTGDYHNKLADSGGHQSDLQTLAFTRWAYWLLIGKLSPKEASHWLGQWPSQGDKSRLIPSAICILLTGFYLGPIDKQSLHFLLFMVIYTTVQRKNPINSIGKKIANRCKNSFYFCSNFVWNWQEMECETFHTGRKCQRYWNFDTSNINILLGIDIDTTKKILKQLQCGKSFLKTFPLQTILFWT